MPLVERGLGDLPAAKADARKALTAAEVHQSRNIAPILASLADVRCARGDAAGGLRLLDRAEQMMRRTHPDGHCSRLGEPGRLVIMRSRT